MASKILHATDQTFGSLVQKGVALVDFYADWCGPCRMLSPIIESLAEKHHKSMNFVKVDTENCQKVAQEHSISSLPTLLLFKDGALINRSVGLRDEESLESLLKKHIA